MKIKFKDNQKEFLTWVFETKRDVLSKMDMARIENGLDEGAYSANQKRRICYQECRKKWLSEYIIYKAFLKALYFIYC